MYRHKNKKNLTKSILLLLILVIGIGYAYLTSNLSIAGNTQVTTNTWDIHFENLNVTAGSVTVSTAASINAAGDAITYTINLNRPKEFYEFTVDVKNDGTLPGKVSISELSGITTDAEPIIDYSIKYTNGNPVTIGDILNAGAKKNIKVRVFYKDEIDPEDFPNDDLNLTLIYTLQYVQSEEDEFDTNALIEQLKTDNSSCFTKYTGQVTDQPGQTVTASNVYFNKCADKRNIIFNNMCWQMIRTTETGGIKMIYNGEPVNDECGTSRSDHKGIVQSNYNEQTLSSSYLYGSSFTYDTSTTEFILVDTKTATWSDSTYQNLLGNFTCKNSNGSCTTLYQINSYKSSTQAYSSAYSIADTNYAQIGTSSYNGNNRSLAMVGYMFNKVYNYVSNSAPTSGSLMGNDVSYSGGIYTLLPANGESELGTTKDDTHHYTCNTTSSTCNKVRYYYYNNYYIELDGAENIESAVNEMLYNNNINTYNSSIKGIVDNWYAQNLSNKTASLEDTIFCNDRNMVNQSTNGWNPDGGSTSTTLQFKNYSSNNDLSCVNETDQFAVSNNKAKLVYPVGLLQNEDREKMDATLLTTGSPYWTISPYSFAYRYMQDGAAILSIDSSGVGTDTDVQMLVRGVRPVISLKTGTVISEGSGSETDPWIVE